MIAIFLQTLPFFALIGLGWFAGRIKFFPPQATAYLTKFVFFFPLSAMLFQFTSTLDIESLFDPAFVAAYVLGSVVLWLVGFGVARTRGEPISLAAMEAHTGMTGNTGFLGVPMLAAILGERAVGPILMVLTSDLVIFAALITIVITGSRQGRIAVAPIALGLIKNPMIVSMGAGMIWSVLHLPMPQPLLQMVTILGAAATPGALFAIGATLATLRLTRLGPAIWLSGVKLILHPLAVAATSLLIFGVDPFAAGVMIGASALPVAGNVYMLAQHYNVGTERVSAAIFVSTAFSILTLPFVLSWVHG
ncbi:malate transporter [Thioclava sp. SK-1]|uniref:AEC family transporter n=1 Tax=Thioclava sp. SK-1 TaxID=1889770 RepID=UPI000824DE19|nr:AEC family transporter [Thioclava sp. SK-1]OCX61108.1 malate transporter [Thioclava sp. SK-1]